MPTKMAATCLEDALFFPIHHCWPFLLNRPLQTPKLFRLEGKIERGKNSLEPLLWNTNRKSVGPVFIPNFLGRFQRVFSFQKKSKICLISSFETSILDAR
uniref:Uncharacterized protein n=1 Tax=Lepeophtheirus salmonis TaxID=72036 RepID=A0A0K2UBN1_LEPSM